MEIKSLRFFPYWSPGNIDQVVGFMLLVSRVLESGPVGRWIEVGGGVGESVTILLGYPRVGWIDVVERLPDRAAYMSDKFANRRCGIHNASSPDAASLFDDGCADVVYIDAAHDYDSVSRDISVWRPKARRFLCGHDHSGAWPGVVRAVRESLGKVEVFPDGSWLHPISS